METLRGNLHFNFFLSQSRKTGKMLWIGLAVWDLLTPVGIIDMFPSGEGQALSSPGWVLFQCSDRESVPGDQRALLFFWRKPYQ